jgi:MinD superfamily P-loop ATPase
MKQLVVLSGKGGTGKTSVTAALADLAARDLPRAGLVLADADVDAANLELVLRPTRLEEHPFMGGQIAEILVDECTGCGRCAELCRFDAILVSDGQYRVDSLACEGCASCFYNCPAGAIRLQERQAGLWYRSDTRFGPLVHARLFAAQENSGKLVSTVKAQARLLAQEAGAQLMLVDGPPGIGCPVIAASAGADLALLVTEPTASGAHDLERVLATLAHFRVPGLVCINKADIDPQRSEEVAGWCAAQGVPVVGRLPYDDVVTEAMVQGDPVTTYQPSGQVSVALRELWANLQRHSVTARP